MDLRPHLISHLISLSSFSPPSFPPWAEALPPSFPAWVEAFPLVIPGLTGNLSHDCPSPAKLSLHYPTLAKLPHIGTRLEALPSLPRCATGRNRPPAQVVRRSGAGRIFGVGPAPPQGTEPRFAAQVPTLFPHLRQQQAPPAPTTGTTCANNNSDRALLPVNESLMKWVHTPVHDRTINQLIIK